MRFVPPPFGCRRKGGGTAPAAGLALPEVCVGPAGGHGWLTFSGGAESKPQPLRDRQRSQTARRLIRDVRGGAKIIRVKALFGRVDARN